MFTGGVDLPDTLVKAWRDGEQIGKAMAGAFLRVSERYSVVNTAALEDRSIVMNRRKLLKLGAGCGLAGAAGMLALQAKSSFAAAFKASDVHSAGYPTVVAVENMGKRLEKFTGGKLAVQMFPSMMLGDEQKTIKQTQNGIIQLARVSAGALAPVVGELNVLNLPFLFRNTAHMRRVIDSLIGQELLDKITSNENANLVGLCWMDGGARSLYNSKKPIRTLTDLKGMRFRVIGNPIFIDMISALGASAAAMGYDRVLQALQNGSVDGAENNPPSFVFDNHYTAAKYYTLTEHLIIPEVLVFSKRVWQALSFDHRAIITMFARQAQLEERALWQDYENEAFTQARAAGVEIIENIEKKPLQEAVKPVWDKYAWNFGEMIWRIEAFL